MPKAGTWGNLVVVITPLVGVSLLWLSAAQAASPGVKGLEGTWCGKDDEARETILQFSVSDAGVNVFTVLSEEDPRQVGSQSLLQLQVAEPNVFVSRGDVIDEVLNLRKDQLKIDSFYVSDRGATQETWQVIASQAYQKCDTRQAVQRAATFLSSPAAEEATRRAIQNEAAQQAQVEELEREEASIQQRRNDDSDAYYADLIHQLGQARSVL